MNKRKSDTIRLIPSRGGGGGGRKKIPGKWVSVSTKTGLVRFSSDLVSQYEWLSNCDRIALEYRKEKNEISVSSSDDGFKVTRRSFPDGNVQYSVVVRAFVGGGILVDANSIFTKKLERFEVKTLRRSFVVNLNSKKT